MSDVIVELTSLNTPLHLSQLSSLSPIMPKIVSDSTFQRVLSQLQKGKTMTSIHNNTGASLGYISKVASEHCPDLPRAKGGCPKKLSAAAACHAVHLVTNGNKTTAVQAAQELQHVIRQPLHAQTVWQALTDAGLKSKKQTKKPPMNKEVMKTRLAWAKAHKDWTVEDWKCIVWSDETTIKHHGSNGIHWVWVWPGEGLNEHTIDPTPVHGGGCIKIWGCFFWEGTGFATKINGNLNQHLYRDILQDELMQSLGFYGLEVDDFIFQHDNAPSHTGQIPTKWLEDHGFQVLDWPPYSPDLNPIENLWAILKRQLGEYEHPPRGMIELWERVEAEWAAINVEICQNLIESMPRRVQEVIKNKGGPIDY